MFFRRGRRLVCVVVLLLGAARVESAPAYTCDNHLVILSNTTAGCAFSPRMAASGQASEMLSLVPDRMQELPAGAGPLHLAEGTEIIQTRLNAAMRSTAFFCAPDYRLCVSAGGPNETIG